MLSEGVIVFMTKIIQKDIMRSNINMVFHAIRKRPGIPQQEITAQTGLSGAMVAKVMGILLSAGLVSEEKRTGFASGRKPGVVSLRKDDRRVLVIDLTGYNFRFGFLNIALEPEGSFTEYSYNTDLSYEDNLRTSLSSMQDEPALRNRAGIVGVGVSVPGPYRTDKDSVLTQLVPELGQISLKRLLCTQISDKPIFIDQDVYHSARYVGSLRARGEQLFYAYVGRGVGGAVFYNGDLLRTAHSYEGEFGQLLNKGGATVENLISTSGIDFDVPPDKETHRKLHQAVTVLARALCDVTWIIDPGVIVIESDYVRLAPDFFKQLRNAFVRSMGDARRLSLPAIEGMPDSGTAHKGSALGVIEEYLKQLI